MAANEVAELQVEIAAELAQLDETTDALIAQFGRLAERVQAGQLPEAALLQKAMELQVKMMQA